MATIVGTNGEESWICDDKGEVIEVFESTGCEYNDLNMCRGCPVCRLHPEEAYGFDDDWSCEEWEAWAREGEDVEVQEPEEELKASQAADSESAPATVEEGELLEPAPEPGEAPGGEGRRASLPELLRPLKVPFAAMGGGVALMLAACLVFPDFGRFMTEAGRWYFDTAQAAHDALMGFLLSALG